MEFIHRARKGSGGGGCQQCIRMFNEAPQSKYMNPNKTNRLPVARTATYFTLYLNLHVANQFIINSVDKDMQFM